MNKLPFDLAPGQFAQPVIDSNESALDGEVLNESIAACDMSELDLAAKLLDAGNDKAFADAMRGMIRSHYPSLMI